MHLLAPLLAALAAADAFGAWTANGAQLELKDENGKLTGRLAAAGGPCEVPPGTELLRGTLLDDSLSAQVRLCLVAPACGASTDTALAVLLVTKTLTGGVHSKADCAKDVRALVLRRPGPEAQPPPAPPPTQRLARTPPPPPRKTAPVVPVGQIAGRPVGPAEHPPHYDPRDARKIGTPQGEAERLLIEGDAFIQEGRFERARKLFHDALDKDPLRAEAYNGVGVTFYARGDLDEALAWYKRALEANPRFGDAYYNMGCAYAVQGHRELAFRYLRMAALNRYSDRQLMEKDPDLEALHDDPQWNDILDSMKP